MLHERRHARDASRPATGSSPLDEATTEKLLAAMMEGTPRRSPFPSLTLVGTPRFRPFRNVWMLEELRDALPAEVGFRYDHTVAAPQSDEARAHHPMGKVPSLLVRDGTEGDFTLIESAAINSWLGDRMREYVVGGDSGFLVPLPGSRDRAIYDSFVQFLVAEADSSGLWIHRKLESLGEKKAFGAVRYALLPARLQFDRAMAGEDMCMWLQPMAQWLQPLLHIHMVTGVRAQLEAQSARQPGYFLVGSCFTAADVLLVHCWVRRVATARTRRLPPATRIPRPPTTGLQPQAHFACSGPMHARHVRTGDAQSFPPRCTAATGRQASTQTRAQPLAGSPSMRTTSCSRTTWAACARDPRTCEPSKSRRIVRPSHEDPSTGDRAKLY